MHDVKLGPEKSHGWQYTGLMNLDLIWMAVNPRFPAFIFRYVRGRLRAEVAIQRHQLVSLLCLPLTTLSALSSRTRGLIHRMIILQVNHN